MVKPRLEAILETGNQQLQKLNDIVLRAIEEEKLISQKLYDFEENHPSFASRMADKMASFGGSWGFISLFFLVMLVWIIANVSWLSAPFDPYPFIFFNLVLSTIAALQAPLIMMSQNRKESKDRQRGINDYMVNLKAEIEIRNLAQKIDLLMSEQIQALFELQKLQVQLMEEIKSAIVPFISPMENDPVLAEQYPAMNQPHPGSI